MSLMKKVENGRCPYSYVTIEHKSSDSGPIEADASIN